MAIAVTLRVEDCGFDPAYYHLLAIRRLSFSPRCNAMAKRQSYLPEVGLLTAVALMMTQVVALVVAAVIAPVVSTVVDTV